PFISVTFNQPMVPLGTLGDLAKEDVPVIIEPEMPGTWRWLGTKTLTFEYDSELIDRLPKATEFTVTVPAGVKSASGAELAEAVSWTFSTPPPQVVSTYPSNIPQPLEPLFFISFDQRINPAAVLKTLYVTAGTRNVDLVLASEAEIENNEEVSALVENTLEGRWLAFRATEPFEPETSVIVTIGPGTPSAEGPLTTSVTQVFSFSTYSPLRIDEHHCYWYDDHCPPLTPFYILFNNPLDLEAFDESMVTVQPEIPGMTINAYGDTIEINGETRGQTTYTVWVSKELQDAFGQKLGSDESVDFKVDKADPVLVGSGKNFITLDPSAETPTLSVYAINYNRLNLSVYAVQPTDWPAFKQYLQNWTQTDAPPPPPGKRVFKDAISLDIPEDTLSQVDIDLSPYIDGNHGQLIVVLEPPAGIFDSDEDKWRRISQTIVAWVQVTQIGLDAYTDHSEMIAWATDLKNGKPLSGVQIQPEVGSPVMTGKDGVVRFDIPSGSTYLLASLGDDRAILPNS
ncbi:MAG TPA: Ig-like domain-containing protein, partial [Anaerolineales bacterium]|nr:Ig-like domain-containing protein [Anaerolineales bacterium]